MKLDIIYSEDCLKGMGNLPEASVDLVSTDPQYGWGFMGKDWDRAVPSVEIWHECLRVLKPGSFAFIMSGPRLDCLIENGMRIREAGFVISFTPIFWCFASGFPKAQNIGKAVDKRLGTERKKIKRIRENGKPTGKAATGLISGCDDVSSTYSDEPATPQAQVLDGSYGGFQPKPAVEVVIVAMKSLSEKTYVDQALQNGKGITWLGEGRIPFNGNENTIRPLGKSAYQVTNSINKSEQTEYKEKIKVRKYNPNKEGIAQYLKTYRLKLGLSKNEIDKRLGTNTAYSWWEGRNYLGRFEIQLPEPAMWWKLKEVLKFDDKFDDVMTEMTEIKRTLEGGSTQGRFPANLLVSDDALNDGRIRKTGDLKNHIKKDGNVYGIYGKQPCNHKGDSGSFSRYFSLDAWFDKKLEGLPAGVRKTFPFLVVPKASKAEKNRGCEGLPEREPRYGKNFSSSDKGTISGSKLPNRNYHPTVKPIKLFSYLITLGSREGDTILDPFIGSGTTAIAARMLGRRYVGYETDPDYCRIAEARLSALGDQLF